MKDESIGIRDSVVMARDNRSVMMKVSVGSIDSRMVNPCRTYITTRKTNDSSRFPWLKAMIVAVGVRQGRDSGTVFSRMTQQESTESMVWSVVGVVPGSIHVCL